MRAAVTSRYGPPEVVHVEGRPVPVPGPGDLLVRVHWSTVNRTDVAYRSAKPWFMRAVAGWKRPRASVGGTEYSGVVEEVGAEASGFAVGDRVFGWCEGRFGAHADYVAVAADSMVATVPDGIDLRTAAATTEGGHYALSFVRRVHAGPDDRVLVHGATGAIGSATVQLLSDRGIRVAATAPTAHLDLVRGLGAERVLDWEREPLSAAGGPFVAVLDAVGKSTFGECRPLLVPRGTYISSDLGPGWQNPLLFVLTRVSRGRRVGFPVPAEGPEAMEYLRERLASGAFTPVLDRTYPLEEIAAAHRYAGSGAKVGSVLVEVAGGA